jgi:ribose transport system substrate-binding protein
MIASITRRSLMALAAVSMLAARRVAYAQDVTIPIIVKDTTSFYWQIVMAGARKAGKDLGVNVPELGAQAETDVNGQISILKMRLPAIRPPLLFRRPKPRRSASRSTKPPPR